MARPGDPKAAPIGTWLQRGAPSSPLRKPAIHNWVTCFCIACRGADVRFIVHQSPSSFALFLAWMLHFRIVAVDRLRDHDHQTPASGYGAFHAHGHRKAGFERAQSQVSGPRGWFRILRPNHGHPGDANVPPNGLCILECASQGVHDRDTAHDGFQLSGS